ncbi:MAG: 4'-phosphopantetheinyl transferase superfamily protein [Alphaproteobacteria bacterium]|nr:4'-phosphopantetheinyl transferase superfamily protein [Alphaproteobacteria bacterium]NCQ66131.1 4'-phosphopantetheinyl transferase superfamily protein [Alphaproteobacteria bacterium]NCT06479.1 4'-phosphopantetheinyl transferase superfamily protein [Alphaproteobacteria bacterium]
MYILKYTTDAPETMALLQKFCPEARQENTRKKSKRPSLAFRRIVVLALVRRLLIEAFNMTLKDALRVLIHREASGAPSLIMPEKGELFLNLHISISHTGPWIALVLSDPKEPVTVDIEDIQKPRAFIKIADNIFSKQEKAYVERYGALGFYYLWGAKEALAKWYKQDLQFALGVDLSDQLCPPSQNIACFIEHSHRKFRLTFLVEEAILLTICKEQGK